MPKFKVGDRVKHRSVPEGNNGVIEKIRSGFIGDWIVYEVRYDSWLGLCHDPEEQLIPLEYTLEYDPTQQGDTEEDI